LNGHDYCIIILDKGLILAVNGLIIIDKGLKGFQEVGNGDNGGVIVNENTVILLNMDLKGNI
jgi:hypothetical protein